MAGPPTPSDHAQPATETTTPAKKPTKKICCACPETKKVRDECVTLHGPDSAACAPLIAAHKVCLRAEGFNIE